MNLIQDKAILFALLRKEAIVVTPTNRLTKQLLQEFANTSSVTIQKKPNCYPYALFLQTLYQHVCFHKPTQQPPILLTSVQSHFLWKQVIASQGHFGTNQSLIQAIEGAWSSCHLWQLSLSHPAFLLTEQTKLFQQWATTFQHELTLRNALTVEQLIPYLITHLQVHRHADIIWACFDDFTPQQHALQRHLNALGCTHYQYELYADSNENYQYAATNKEDERHKLTHWLTKTSQDGPKRIGVIVPNLAEQLLFLQHELANHIPLDQINISLGQALITYPLISHALRWLSLADSLISSSDAQLLLQSPYIGFSHSEIHARLQLLEESVCLKEAYFPLSSFRKELSSKTPKLAHLLDNIVSYPQESSPQHWVTLFKQRLNGLLFPGEYSLDSLQHQCYQRFLRLLDEFNELGFITELMSKEEAITALYDLASNTVFQAQKALAPIQIVGLLEAAGCTFDSLWVMDLTDQCFPQKLKPSAFIPLQLQRTYHMPHASPERELQLAKKTMIRLQASSPYNVFSYAMLNGDQPNAPSPFIEELTHLNLPEMIASKFTSSLIAFTENYALPVGQQELIRGGANLLANQAKCSFRAFAAHRLHCKAGIDSSQGPNPMERGQALHQMMEIIWQTLKNQHHLMTINAHALNNLIEHAIDTALIAFKERRPYSFPPLIENVEKIRLKKIMMECLSWEQQRPSFVVHAIEKSFEITLDGIQFTLRIDRMDKTADGKTWIIDYKSSIPTHLPWKDEKLLEPQLLLYALLEENITTLLLLQLKTGQLICKGFGEKEHTSLGITGIKENEDWLTYKKTWYEQLLTLVVAFKKGVCMPQPTSPAICRQCDYHALCRFSYNAH